MAKIKVRRTNREELPGVALLRSAVSAETPVEAAMLDLDMAIDPTLEHLMTHDPDGFFSALDNEETLGFAAAHMRSRQWVLSDLWVLQQHQGRGAGEALLKRVLTYGERSGARSYLAVVPAGGRIQSLLLRHDFRPGPPVYLFRLRPDTAEPLAASLARLLPGQEVSRDLLERRGQSDLDRIDRLVRGMTREADHVFWLKQYRMNAAFVRQANRVAAYAYGGAEQAGPVAGNTQDAALAALGWSIQFARRGEHRRPIELLVPAPFSPAVDALLEADARLCATLLVYGRGSLPSFDRCVLGSQSLP
ncbi:MAG: GNAT family N-acetyltransferase [Acidobacteria bacterium]|nr:GNAT family N-acetyltransferase [Acidobacteriota bacterium]